MLLQELHQGLVSWSVQSRDWSLLESWFHRKQGTEELIGPKGKLSKLLTLTNENIGLVSTVQSKSGNIQHEQFQPQAVPGVTFPLKLVVSEQSGGS